MDVLYLLLVLLKLYCYTLLENKKEELAIILPYIVMPIDYEKKTVFCVLLLAMVRMKLEE